MNKLIEIGKITNTHGLKGELKVVATIDSPDCFARSKEVFIDNVCYKIKSFRAHMQFYLIVLDGVDGIDTAEAFKNKLIYAELESIKLPKGTYLIEDMLGLSVTDVDTGEEYGVLTQVYKTGANDVYEVKNQSKTYLIPAIKQCIIETDIKNKTLKIRPLPGLMDIY